MPREGIFAKVLIGGEIKVGDLFQVVPALTEQFRKKLRKQQAIPSKL